MAGTLISIFLETIAAHRKPAQFVRRVGDGWEDVSAEQSLKDVEHLGLGLSGLGITHGDRVALLSENRYEWPITDLAILGLGAVTVPIYPTLTAEQVRFIIDNAGAKAVILSSAEQLAKLKSVADRLPSVEAFIMMDAAPGAGGKDLAMRDVMARGADTLRADSMAFRNLANKVVPEDVATIIYTSGTTGEPKGAMLTHANIVSNVDASLQVISITPADKNLSFLPLCHIFERMAGLYAALRGGSTIAYAQSPETVAADAAEVKPTWLTGVPRFYEKVYARVMENAATFPPIRRAIFDWALKNGREVARSQFERRHLPGLVAIQAKLGDKLVFSKIRDRIGGRIQFAVSGGAPLNPQVMEFFFAIGIPVQEGYGLTETSPVICLSPPGRARPGSVGPAVPGVEVKIGEEGEIITRGPHVMKGYYKNEEATRACIRDGWFHTGDVGRLDEHGYLYITDRLKELIVLAGGKKVAPQPLEGRLKNSPVIGEAVLIGEQKAYIACLLVPDFAQLELLAKKRGWPGDRATLLQHPEVQALYQSEVDNLNKDLARFEQIKRFALLGNELSQDADELTPTLKVKRRVIDRRYEKTIKELYAGHSSPVDA